MKQGRVKGEPVLSDADRKMYSLLAQHLGIERLIATGSRVRGYAIASSDYDCIAVAPSSEALKLHAKAQEWAAKNKVKVDMTVSDKNAPPEGYYVEADNGKV